MESVGAVASLSRGGGKFRGGGKISERWQVTRQCSSGVVGLRSSSRESVAYSELVNVVELFSLQRITEL